jgi:hypothetical protein
MQLELCSLPLEVTLLAGWQKLGAAHWDELPQRDDLCGAFCGALALRAAGIQTSGEERVDQDAVARAAGSVVGAVIDRDHLPFGASSRRNYRFALPSVADPTVTGTTAAGLCAAIEELGGGKLAAIPYSGPWTVGTLDGLFATVAELERPMTLIANLATRHLWGGGATGEQLMAYLRDGDLDGPAPDWDVGHFVCVYGRMQGPGGSMYWVADTYGSLGEEGVHLQPQERLAAAIARQDMPAGGVIVVASVEDATAVRVGAAAAGLVEELWDNGTVALR